MKQRANVKAVVVRKKKESEIEGGKSIPERELVQIDLGYVVGNQPTREDVLRHPEAIKACEGIPSSELEVAFQRNPFTTG